MFNRLHTGERLTRCADARRHARICDRNAAHGDIDRLGKIYPTKNNTRIDSGRTQAQFHPLPAVDAHACGFDEGFDGFLRQHDVILVDEKQSGVEVTPPRPREIL